MLLFVKFAKFAKPRLTLGQQNAIIKARRAKRLAGDLPPASVVILKLYFCFNGLVGAAYMPPVAAVPIMRYNG